MLTLMSEKQSLLIDSYIVQVFVEFTRIGEIDTLNEKFQAEIIVEAKWITKEIFKIYDPNSNWNPKLYIENALSDYKEIISYSVSNDYSNNFKVITELRTIKGFFWERLELQNFPFDIQELSVSIASKLDINQVKILPDKSRKAKLSLKAINTFVEQQKWRLFKMVKIGEDSTFTVMSSFVFKISPFLNDSETTAEYPKIKASFFCSRRAGYYLFNAFFLIFLITSTTFTIFGIDCKLPQQRIPAACTFLLASISFKWVINRSLPTISYLTSLDKYSISSIFFICLHASWHSVVGSDLLVENCKVIDKWGLIGLSGIFIVFNVFYLIRFITSYFKVYQLKKIENRCME